MKICFDQVRSTTPLIHSITNYITANDVANILLAAGASPIMADDIREVEEITTICGGLNINIGSLNQATTPAMFLAGNQARVLGRKILLDPVGAGASNLRTETSLSLMEKLRPDVIRGNISEIKTLANGRGNTRGVDADAADTVTEETLESSIRFAKQLSASSGSIIAITGAIDLIADAKRCYVIRNGRPEMGRVTGTGCQLSGLITAFLVANPDRPLEATAAAVCAMGLAGEIAYEQLLPTEGNSSYRNRLIDAIYRMDGARLEAGAKYALR